MIKSTLTLFLTFFILHTSLATDTDTLRIPIHQSKGAEVEELFQKIQYIPLESNKQSMIQEVDDMWVTKNDIIIFDQKGNSILFFNPNGTFKHKINKVPNCNECNRSETLFTSVFVNKEKGLVYAAYGTSMENVTLGIFDFKGNLVGEHKNWYTVGNMGFIANSIILRRYYHENKKFDKLQVFQNDTFKTLSYFDADFKNDYTVNSNIVSKNSYDGKLYFAEPYTTTLYTINEQGYVNQSKLLFPLAYSLPVDFVKNNNGKLWDVLKSKYPNAIFSINNVMKVKNYLVLNLMSHIALNNLSSILYDTNAGTIYDLKKIRPSSFNNYMPLSSALSESFFLDQHQGSLYSLVYQQDLINAFADGPDAKKIDQAPSYMKSMVKNPEQFKNPILTISTLK